MEFNEIGEEEPPEVDALSDSSIEATDVSMHGRGSRDVAPGRETWGVVSASLGAMRPVVAKIDELLLDHASDWMRLLSEEIKKISSYLDELSEVEDPPRTAECWMNEARDLSYDIEDYIDNLIFVQDMEEMESKFSKHVQEAIERYDAYVLPHFGKCSTLRPRFVSLGLMLSTSSEDIVIDGRMNEFINSFAKDEESKLKVVSVLGSACLGKTTLARELYNKLGELYHCRAFVRVSRKPDMKRIFRDMLWQLQREEPPEYRNEPDLMDNIKKYLQNKSYLIIVDDVWAASVWDTINDALPNGSHGSRIVTTTRIEDVALACCCHQSELVFEMKPLDDDHSRELFFNRLFGSESNCPEIFREVSNRIVEMCDGLPFATISIASLLASQPAIQMDLLEHIHKSLSSCFSSSSTSERTREALNLSLNNLPPDLKTCLLYLGMRGEGYIFCKDDLVTQWMAEGFIHTTEGQDPEKVAESYLYQLIGRRFVQPIRISNNNDVLSCAVHDTVHDLIAHKSAEVNFIVAIDHSQTNVALSYNARRLSLFFEGARYARTPENMEKSQVRSLTFVGLVECMPFITEFKLLRVLVLQISGHDGEDNPVDLTGISELIRLRYLKIGCGICIRLPTHGVQCLETLDVSESIVTTEWWDTIRPCLLHLSLSFQRSLLYRGLNYFSDMVGNDIPSFIKAHGNLRTVVFSHGSKIMNRMVHGAIKVITSKPSKEVIISGAPLLQRFECSPSSGLTFLRTPKWIKEFHNLCILKITVRIVEMDCVGILSELRALTALSLYVRSQSTEKITFDMVGFSAIKYFKLRFTSGVAWIKFEAGAMPNLLKLKLVFSCVPRKDQQLYFICRRTDRHKQYKRGNALIVIEHMPSLGEIYAKFGGATADLDRFKGIGISVAPSINPSIFKLEFVDSSSYGDQSTKQKHQEEILEKDPADDTLAKATATRSPQALHVFTLDELIAATSNFSDQNFLADHKRRNPYTTFFCPGVYTGSLEGNLRPGLEPQQVMVKCLNKFSDDPEWLIVDQMELEYIGALTSHPHLVKLLGFCDYYEHRMLVYEHMPSLEQCLSGDVRELTWLRRLKIAVGAAKGLAYLHETDKLMVQTDFKSSHVLLDSDNIAKLYGYQLANENLLDKTQNSFTVEKDVYNFGVVLLKLLTSRQAIKASQPEYLVDWCRPYLSRQDKLHHIIHPSLKGEYYGHAAWIAATIVRRCLHYMREKRPSMSVIIEGLELEYILVEGDKPSQSKNAHKEARAGAGVAGDSNWNVSSSYPREWEGQHKFTLDELMSATGNFLEENLIGEADFGHIYKGTIDGKIMVAVMKLRPDCDDWLLPRAWQRELQHVESMRKPHLVRLLGYCDQDEQCVLLVYEYMPRGSLSEIMAADLLTSIPLLTRINIAVGAATGLSFLHKLDIHMIYHTGFTSSNILLDSDYTPKLWGFGPGKYLNHEERMATDVYNFGVVLAELLVGQCDIGLEPQTQLIKMLNSRVGESILEHEAAKIAKWCMEENLDRRPSMREVADVLVQAQQGQTVDIAKYWLRPAFRRSRGLGIPGYRGN